jgi:hypothetical protein
MPGMDILLRTDDSNIIDILGTTRFKQVVVNLTRNKPETLRIFASGFSLSVSPSTRLNVEPSAISESGDTASL